MRCLTKSVLLLSAAFVAKPSIAQTTVEQKGAGPVDGGEIVVTAQKREQRLVDTPMSISAFGEGLLQAKGTNSVAELASSAPGLSGAQVSATQPLLTVRGIGTNDFSIGVDPALGMFVDEVYVGRSSGAITNIFDIERVEIVKGPQGTLFGRNTTAGAISIIRNKPVDRFEVQANADYGTFNLANVSSVLNAPLGDRTAVRASVYYRRRDGDNPRVGGGKAVERLDSFSGRLALGHKGVGFVYDVNVDYQRDRNGGPAYQSRTYNGAIKSLSFQETATGLSDDELKANRDIVMVNGRGSIELGGVSLTSISSYRHYKIDYVEDTDGGPTNILTFGTLERQNAWSQEARVNYTGQRVSGFIGASVYQEVLTSRSTASYDEEAVCGGASRANGLGTLSCGALLNVLSGGLVPTSFKGLADVKETVFARGKFSSWGVYGDVTVKLSGKLELIVGARYSSDRKRISVNVPTPNTSLAPIALGAPTIFVQATNGAFNPDVAVWTNFSPRAAFRYAITPDINFYGNVSFGYKSGGFNVLIPQKGKFNPEEVTSFEAGVKGALFDKRLQFDISGFYYTYSDLQVQIVEAVTYTNNAGSARGYGAESSLTLRPVPGVSINGTLSLLDARYTRYSPQPGVDYRNNRLNRAPTVSGSFGADYTFLSGGAGSLLLGSDVRFQSKQFFNPDNSKVHTGRGYAVVDARVTWRSNIGKYSLTAYVQNLNNARYETQTQAINDFNIAIFRAGDQRRVGVRATVNF